MTSAGVGRAFGQLDSSDPWPKFGQNEKNNCRTGVRGPHSLPELRWWAPAGVGATVGGSYVARSGAVVADINGVRCVIVPGNDAGSPAVTKLRIFRFHPCNSSYDPLAAPAAPIATITVSSSDEYLVSTPLVTEDNYVVVQTTKRVRCYDLNAIDTSTACSGTLSVSSAPLWVYPALGMFDSDAASPGAGAIYEGGDKFVVVVGRVSALDPAYEFVRVAWLDPANGDIRYEATAAYGAPQITSTPAVGPIDNEGHANFTYVTLFGATNQLNSSNSPCDWQTDPGCYRANLCALAFYGDTVTERIGVTVSNWGSPVLHDDGDILLPCDDGKIYTFDNVLGTGGFLPTRWDPENLGPTAFSATAGVFDDRSAVVWHEQGGRLCRIVDPTTGDLSVSDYADSIGYHVGGTPALDGAARFFANTDLTTAGSYRVVARKNELTTDDPPRFKPAWRRFGSGVAVHYAPPTITIGSTSYVLSQRFESGPALDSDGTILCTNEGYVLALRPMLGDFNGDGCRNNFDIDAFVTAVLHPELWESGDEENGEGFGSRFGINLLGVGDCNNDGHFDNADIDCFVSNIVNHPPVCPEGVVDDDYDVDPQGQSAMSQGGFETSPEACSSAAPDEAMDHFWDMIAYLRSEIGGAP